MGWYANTVFPWILERVETRQMAEQRSKALADVHGDVLEIGLGTGRNLPYYPLLVRKLSAVEPSQGMERLARARAAQYGIDLDLRRTAGKQLPFDAASFDTVVVTLVLCTAQEVPALLREVQRVLRPRGRYVFLEHVAATDPRLRRWQTRLNRVHRRVGCGCELVRDSERAIETAGFRVDRIEHVTLTGRQALYPLIRGVAVHA